MSSPPRLVTTQLSRHCSSWSEKPGAADMAMRPVDKGVAPAEYARYQDAGRDLQARLGDFCSYCERQIETHLAVEHVQPKIRRASLRNAWSYFLLGCVHFNSRKGKKRVALRDYYWPDNDNT